ncbi:MAG TPA: hypothetical protein VM260_17810, partial [Pirellula sp.]|nr:hypothetical protein [Pirellula sp.]
DGRKEVWSTPSRGFWFVVAGGAKSCETDTELKQLNTQAIAIDNSCIDWVVLQHLLDTIESVSSW